MLVRNKSFPYREFETLLFGKDLRHSFGCDEWHFYSFRIQRSFKKFPDSPRKGGTIEIAFHNFFYFIYIVPLNINIWSSNVHALLSSLPALHPQAMFMHCFPLSLLYTPKQCSCIAILSPCSTPPSNPLQHGLFPKWRPGSCDLSLENK